MSKKKSRAEKKALRKQQRANEKKLVAAGKISPRVKYMRRSFLWNLIAICIAFFFGIFAGLGALLGGGLYAANKMTMKGLLGEEVAEKYIGKDYYDKSPLDMISDFTDMLGGGIHTLDDIGQFSPFLKDTMGAVNNQLAPLGITLDIDELMGVDLGAIGQYMQDNVVQKIELGKALALTADSDDMMLALCYGEEGKDYTVNADGEIVCENPTTVAIMREEASALLDRITVETAFRISADSPPALRFLAYGAEGEQYKIENGQIVMLPNYTAGNNELYRKKTIGDLTVEDATVLQDAKIRDLVDTSDADGLVKAIEEWRVSELTDGKRIQKLKISQILTIDDNSSNIMRAMKDWRICDLTSKDKIDSLALSDILDLEDAPKILKSLGNTHLGEFGDKIDTLRLCDILEDEDFEGNDLLKCLKNSTLTTLAEDISGISVLDLFGEDIYSYTEGEAGTYAKQLKEYKESGHLDKDASAVRPLDNAVEYGTQIDKEFWTNKGGMARQIDWGSFVERSGKQTLLENPSLYKDTADATLFTLTKTEVLPVYGWYKMCFGENESDIRLTEDALSITRPSDGVDMSIRNRKDTPCETAKFYLEKKDGKTYYYPLYEDGFSVYYLYYATNQSGEMQVERQDLERRVVGYTYRDKTPVEAELTVYQGKGTGFAYYVERRETVTQHYYSELNKEYTFYEESDVTVRYFANIDGKKTEVDPYLSGVWYLLFGGEDEDGNPVDNTHRPVLEIDEELTNSVERIEEFRLWELYFHEFINDNPYEDLSDLRGKGITIYDNLNECTIRSVISLVKNLTAAMKQTA